MILGATSVYKRDKGLFAREFWVLKCVHKCVQRCVQCVQSVSEWLTRRDPIMAWQVVGELRDRGTVEGRGTSGRASRVEAAGCQMFLPPGQGAAKCYSVTSPGLLRIQVFLGVTKVLQGVTVLRGISKHQTSSFREIPSSNHQTPGNTEVSDGGGPQSLEFGNRCRPPPFAPPKS